MSRIEKTATAAVFFSFLLLAGALTRSYVISRRPNPAALPEVKIGQTVKLPGLEDTTGSTLVLAITSHCPYCVEGLPFYRRLAEFGNSSAGGLRLIAVLPENTGDARAFLERSGVTVASVLSMSPQRLGVRIFPTLLLLDQNGKLQKYWVGELSDDAQQEVISTLKKYCATCRMPRADLRVLPSTRPESTPALSINLL